MPGRDCRLRHRQTAHRHRGSVPASLARKVATRANSAIWGLTAHEPRAPLAIPSEDRPWGSHGIFGGLGRSPSNEMLPISRHRLAVPDFSYWPTNHFTSFPPGYRVDPGEGLSFTVRGARNAAKRISTSATHSAWRVLASCVECVCRQFEKSFPAWTIKARILLAHLRDAFACNPSTTL